MAIFFSNEHVDFDLPESEKVKRWITHVVRTRGKRVGEVNYIFCDDAYLIEVNRTYLDHDTYTDIITFDYVAGNIVSGDIFISIERVRENARLFDTSFEHELHRVLIHGILHLLGQGDKSETEAKEMRNLEEECLKIWNTIQ
jgi:rRNA maturation RNase YbeY